jgi:acyl-CoA dehydrogenase
VGSAKSPPTLPTPVRRTGRATIAPPTSDVVSSLGPGRGRIDVISIDTLYPFPFNPPTAAAGVTEYRRDPGQGILAAFFQAKGLTVLKQEDRQEEWYPDWIAYQATHGLYAGLLSSEQYSTRGHRLDILKLTRFLEAFAYFSPAHAYSLHVSFLGLFPVLMSANERLKREAMALLEGGGLLAFGVSERNHGADLLANEFTVRDAPPNGRVADGAKCYIGNANAAGLMAILGKKGGTKRRSPLVLFALRPQEPPGLNNLQKVRTLGIRGAFVGEFELAGHPVPETDVIAEGRDAWDAVFNTVNFGKFFLGFGAVGICEHALFEAHSHLTRRVLYGKPVIALPHIRVSTAVAFARLTAMKFYAYRALDYLQAAADDDRRYLLFHAVQKARVSTEGAKVMGLLSECVGAKGFEANTYFESALREAPMIPSLEGSTHVNLGLTAQFLDPYFADPADPPQSPGSLALGGAAAVENPYWLNARDRTPRTVRFAHYLRAYRQLRAVPNVRLFVKQVRAYREFARGVTAMNLTSHTGLLIAVGKCFAVIVYAQLVAETCAAVTAAPETVSVIFHALVEDLSEESLRLAAMFPPAAAERAVLRLAVRVPRTSPADLESVSGLLTQQFGG